ncbi:MAG: TlpA family protein disulfide reductase [Chitinispirillaceae bacterium]
MKLKAALLMGLVLVISAFTIYSGGEKTQNNSQKSNEQKVYEEKMKLLVFINPNGRPCLEQIRILDSMNKKLEKKAEVVYVSTTESADRKEFYKYGIRALPSMIIVDKKGKELERFTPGIHNENSISSAFSLLKNKGI